MVDFDLPRQDVREGSLEPPEVAPQRARAGS